MTYPRDGSITSSTSPRANIPLAVIVTTKGLLLLLVLATQMNILEHVSDCITRIELCEHWEPWDDCYDCSPELPEDHLMRTLGPDILIYLVSPTAHRGTVTEWGSHVG